MQRPFEVPESIYPFESRWIEVEGIPVHYFDVGSGPTILCVHGNPSWSLLYAQVAMHLKDRFRVVAPDLPGFGMSGKPEIDDYGYTPEEHSRILEGFVKAMNLDSFMIFVQDWGGPIGLGMAGRNSERIKGLIIGNTWAWPFDLTTAQGQASKEFSERAGGEDSKEKVMQKNGFVLMSLPMLQRGVRKRNKEHAEAMKQAWLAPFPTPESRLPTWVFPGRIMKSAAWLGEVEENFAQNLGDKPTLFIWGEKDPVFPASILEDWKKRVSHYEIVMLPDASHFFQDEEPERIAAEVRKFAAAL